MSLAPTLRALLNEAVTVERIAGRDAYGKPSYAAAATWAARVEYGNLRVRSADGQEYVARATVFLPPEATGAVGLGDRITLPDGSTPVILEVRPLRDERGPHHVEVYTG